MKLGIAQCLIEVQYTKAFHKQISSLTSRLHTRIIPRDSNIVENYQL